MAVKIADTLKALSNTFPVAECVDIDVNINGTTKRLQKAIDDGEIGGGSDSTWKGTHEEWEALSTEEKGKYEVICFTDDYDESGICGSDSTWKGTHEEWEALSTEEKGKYEVVYFTDDYDGSGTGESDSIWKGTRDEWEALLTAEKQKYVIVYFTDDYNDSGDGIGLIDDTNTSVKTTYSSSKIENSLSKKANTTDLTVHTSDTNIHVTTAERTKWNKVDNKIDKTSIVDNLTSTDTDKPLSANQGKILKGEVGLKANYTDLTAHTGNTGVHITTAERTKWNKVDNKANVTDLTSHTSDTNTHITTNERTKWNEVDNKVNKTDITTTINGSSTDTQVPSAKRVWDSLYKICDTQVLVDANKPTSKMCIADLTTINTPSKEGMTGAEASLIISVEGREYWNGQISITMAEPSVFVRSVNNTGTWTSWQRLCNTTVADVGMKTITPTFPSTVTLGSSQRIIYSIKNGWANVSTVMQFASPKLSWVVIATGLPKPDKTVNTSTVGETFVNANVAYRIKTDGTLEMLINSEITQLNWWNINVSYPVAEQ